MELTNTIMGFSVIGLLICGIILVGCLLIIAVRMIIKGERKGKLNARLQAAIEDRRIAQDAEAHHLNVSTRWEG